jgi:redox-sensitive bicupin YhaK (pirin superfamily)
MEIVSYVIDGGLGHRDTLGTGSVIRPGEVQRMSAGAGIAHSEMNASTTEPVHFLQIWILPARRGTPPGYAQQDFGRDPGVRLVVSPDGRDGSLTIGQDADLVRFLLLAGQSARWQVRRKQVWVQLIRGEIRVNGAPLTAGDGAAITDEPEVSIAADADAEALLFDLR